MGQIQVSNSNETSEKSKVVSIVCTVLQESKSSKIHERIFNIHQQLFVSTLCKIQFVFLSFERHPGEFGGKCWNPVSKNMNDKFRCLDIVSADKYEMVDIEDPKTMKFWLNLLPLENKV